MDSNSTVNLAMQRNNRNTYSLVSWPSYLVYINLKMSSYFRFHPCLPVYSSEIHAMPCHIRFLGFVSCFLHRPMLINCCFVLAFGTVHSKRGQEEW